MAKNKAAFPAQPSLIADKPVKPAKSAKPAKTAKAEKSAKPTKLSKADYADALAPLALELNGLARWLQHTGQRVAVVIEGRDTAGKGGVIAAVADAINPRQCRVVALPKPSEREQTQWYFQRYVAHLPSAGEIVLFDRSWYNRAGVEKVMGYCSAEQSATFLKQAPLFERMLVDDGILLLKYWLCVDQDKQEERFAERQTEPLKRWKLSPVDLQARLHYADYGHARDAMLKATHSRKAPWTLVDFNDQRRGRLSLVRHLLDQVPEQPVPETTLMLPPLEHALLKERFKGALRPIKPYKV